MPEAERLQSWKEIAAYLRRSVATVQRWEREEGLPVHRHFHHKLGSVYAYTAEVDAWRDRLRADPLQPVDSAATGHSGAGPLHPLHLRAGAGVVGHEQLRRFRQLTGMRVRAFLSRDIRMASELAAAQLKIAEALGDDALLAEVHIDLGFLELHDGARAAEHTRLAMDALRRAGDGRRPLSRGLLLEVQLLAALTAALTVRNDVKSGVQR